MVVKDYLGRKKNCERLHIVVEDPTYRFALPILEKTAICIERIPMGKFGIDVDMLKEKLETGLEVVLAYVIPFFQNPTGTSLSLENSKKLIDLSKKFNFSIISDETYLLLDFRIRGPHLPLVSYDYPPYTVYSLGSFSKIVSPGLRTAWVHCKGKLRERILEEPMFASGGGFCGISCALLQPFISSGSFTHHVNNVIDYYKKNSLFLFHELAHYFPDNQTLEFSEPQGGYFLWVELKHKTLIEKKNELEQEMKKKNVLVMFGHTCSSFFHNFFRLSFSNVTTENMKRGIALLVEVVGLFLQEGL
eukprot:TRINITY_DN6671_c0_g4_i1.p1 TRINITY_DN6671_c0_g4~~TRINITY_DN6671_c0_g4_i1.p1  ORF type:complete len:304 (-),score=57.74 TRINITY_DN6671_c0_g4_i1:71-982(-)